MNILVSYKRFLTIVNVILLCLLILLYHIGFLTDIFFVGFLIGCLVVFGFALYRPVMTFAIFVGLLPLEIIDIAPEVIGLSLRPYQVMGVAALFGMVSALLFRKEIRKVFSWNIFDTIITIFIGVSVTSAFLNTSTDGVWLQTIIFISFGILYFVTRCFVHDKKDVVALLPIIISSGVIIGLYSICQNILFLLNKMHFEVMPGRPNATFAEPDWLGIYLVFLFAMCLTYLYYNAYHKHLWKFFDIALYISSFIIMVALIVTVARSAWIGVFVVLLLYFFVLIVQKKYKLFARHFLWSTSLVFGSVIFVILLQLTNFELGNRVQSTGTGRQEITVSCSSQESLESLMKVGHISHVRDLAQYKCQHIKLEEIDSERLEGKYVIKIYRDDPNVSVRSDIYKEAIAVVQIQPLFGYGWGSSTQIFGSDESGTPLNASNLFFETAIATGLVGMITLSMFFAFVIFFAITVMRSQKSMLDNSIALFALLGVTAIIVPNMFNAGLLLGFVWVYFGMVAILAKVTHSNK